MAVAPAQVPPAIPKRQRKKIKNGCTENVPHITHVLCIYDDEMGDDDAGESVSR